MFFSKPSNIFKSNHVFDHKDQGIPQKDLDVFIKYAITENVILLFRPVEPLTKTLHEAGQNPTKNFKIKGKSSSWGLWAGFIPINQYYSKLNGVSNATQIASANLEIQGCIQGENAQPIPLIITEQRYQELRKKGIIFPQKKKEGEYLVIYCPHPHVDDHPSKLELSYAKKIHTETGPEYVIFTAEKQAFNVLADTKLKKALIADYDPLAFWEPWKNYGPDNKRPNQEITHKERCRKLSPNEKQRSEETPENFYAREDPNLGNVAPLTKKHIAGLNKALKKGEGLECLHHNDDAGSPASKPAANYPITAIIPIIPQIEDFTTRVLLLETPAEFVDFINKVSEYFRVMANPLWELPVKWAAIRKYFLCKIRLAYSKDNSRENIEQTLKEMFNKIDLNDATMIKELIYLFNFMMDTEFDSDTLFNKFFDIIQTSILVNSTLVVKFCRTLKFLLDCNALSESKIDQLLTMNKILRKDVQGFYDILYGLHFLPEKNAITIDDYLKLAETNIYNNQLNPNEFEKDLQKFTSEFKVVPPTFRPKI